MRISLIDPCLQLLSGHHLDLDLRLAQALRLAGHDVVMVAAVDLEPSALERLAAVGLQVHRTCRFPTYLAGLPDTPETFRRCTEGLVEDLATVPESDLWLWPTLTSHQFLAAMQSRSIRMVGGIWFPPHFHCASEPQGWAAAVRLARARPHPLLLGAYHDTLAEIYRSMFGTFPWARFPTPYDGGPQRQRTGLGSIGFLGEPRVEKGAHLVASAAARLLACGYQVTVQGRAGDPPLVDHPSLRTIVHVEDFPAEVARHDLIVWPARASAYRFRHSGVVGEAVASGVPLVLPGGCLPARLVGHTGGGIFMQGVSADAIVAAVEEAAQQYPRLAQAAQAGALEWQKAEGTERLVQTILQWLDRPVPAVSVSSDVADVPAPLDLEMLEKTLLKLSAPDPGFDASGRLAPFRSTARLLGQDCPAEALTMAGLVRLRNIRTLMERVLQDDVPGDFLEAGVWRGGAAIYMRGVLAAHQVRDRRVVAADSFCGDPRVPGQAWKPIFAVPLQAVQANFARHGLLDDQVVFWPGWFHDVLPSAPVQHLAVLRIDAGGYAATMDTLNHLYDKVSPGGYVIVDGYGTLPAYRDAVTQYRRRAWVSAPLVDVDGVAVYWQKPGLARALEVRPGVDVEPVAPLLPVRDRSVQVSVLIPTHDRPAYLTQCLESVLRQDPGPDVMEILVVDDASADDMKSLVAGLAGDRVRYLRRDPSVGQWRNVNLAVAESKGDWIHILHDDDFVLDDFYRIMLDATRRIPGTVGVICCGYSYLFETTGTTKTAAQPRPDAGILHDWLASMSVCCLVEVPSVMVRRRVYETQGLYNESFTCADWEFYLRSARQYDWWYQPENLARYRVHGDSFGQSRQLNGVSAANRRRVIELAARTLPADLAERAIPQARKYQAATCITWASQAFEAGHFDAAVHLVAEAMAVRPLWS